MTLRRVWRSGLILLGLWALGGCSTLFSRAPAVDGASPVALAAWELRADLLAAGVHTGRANLRWQQDGQSFLLTLSGPFGLGGVRLQGDPEQVIIEQGRERWTSDTPQADLQRLTGILLPLEQLEAWVRGLPDSEQRGRPPRRWNRGEWSVEVLAAQAVGGYLLPESLSLETPGQRIELGRMRWEGLR